MLRILLLALLLNILLICSSGCLLPVYSGDPETRISHLVNQSEGLRLIPDEWQRFWLLDQPNHMTIYRVHGGII
ncbi:MAG: hypothetical protein LBB88_10310 [Planctomycetaceae bacterium]|jgi:hypothetical protein|nr:hypothetical protein [Planctomycetaceae bacterium]